MSVIEDQVRGLEAFFRQRLHDGQLVKVTPEMLLTIRMAGDFIESSTHKYHMDSKYAIQEFDKNYSLRMFFIQLSRKVLGK